MPSARIILGLTLAVVTVGEFSGSERPGAALQPPPVHWEFSLSQGLKPTAAAADSVGAGLPGAPGELVMSE